MNLLIGNKIKKIETPEFENIIKDYKALVLDIGTGDGEFVYKRARENSNTMYIGIDAAVDAMGDYSIKVNKKAHKGGLKNVMYVVSNAYDLPNALNFTADEIFINLPWGSLRDGVIKGETDFLNNIKRVSKLNTRLNIYISYSELYEKSEIEGRHLPELTIDYIKNCLKWKYWVHGINILEVIILNNEALKKLDTKWSKKLGYGKKRNIFLIKCIIQNVI